MKTNNKKIIVGALGLLAGAGLVGSLSGSVAWYQYSTRATMSYMGTSVHCTEALQISLDGTNWYSDLNNSQIQTAADTHTGMKLQPITEGAARARNLATAPTSFKGNPIYQYFDYANWIAADDAAYLQYDVYLRVKDINGEATEKFLEKDVYLADLTVAANAKTGAPYANAGVTGADFAKGLRFHITDGTTGNLITTHTDDISTTLGGYLDLNNDNADDKSVGYEWQETTATKYGNDTFVQTAGKMSSFDVNDDVADFDITEKTALGRTNTKGNNQALKFTVTIWLEGWALLGDPAKSVWDVSKYIHDFQIGMRFAVKPHGDHA